MKDTNTNRDGAGRFRPEPSRAAARWLNTILRGGPHSDEPDPDDTPEPDPATAARAWFDGYLRGIPDDAA